MDKFDQTSLPDGPDITASIIESGIADVPLTSQVEVTMQRLLAAGVPIDRMNVGVRILHPLFDGMSITWTREDGAEVNYAKLVDQEGSEFRLSPFYVMLSEQQREWRLRLDTDRAAERFPLLMQLKTKGFTDYLALIVAFGGAPLHPQSYDGIGASWSTRAPEGFSAADIVAMRVDVTLEQALQQIRAEGHSRLPVYREQLDDIIGMVHIKDVIAYVGRPDAFSLEAILRKPLMVAPQMPVPMPTGT